MYLGRKTVKSPKHMTGPATGHLDTGFSRFTCAYKQMLRWFPTFQVATTCFSCSPPDLNLAFILCVFAELRVYCCFYFICRTAG